MWLLYSKSPLHCNFSPNEGGDVPALSGIFGLCVIYDRCSATVPLGDMDWKTRRQPTESGEKTVEDGPLPPPLGLKLQ